MAKRGPKPVPLLLKTVHGNPGKRALPVDVPEGSGGLWAPPDWFNDQQRAQWDYALEHAPMGLLSGTDREVLVIWCVAAVEHAIAVVEVRRLGQVVKTREGNAIQNPFLGIVNRQAFIMLRAGGEMGFSPAARTALGRDPAEAARGGSYFGAAGAPRGALDEYLAEKPDKLDS